MKGMSSRTRHPPGIKKIAASAAVDRKGKVGCKVGEYEKCNQKWFFLLMTVFNCIGKLLLRDLYPYIGLYP